MNQNLKIKSLKANKIQTLDSIRFFMIFLIVMSHFDTMQNFESTCGIYRAFRISAGMAVDYFFVLSGFGMMYSYVNKEPVLSLKPVSLVDFAIKHVKKLYRLYLILLLICIPYDILSYYDVYGNIDIRCFVNEIIKLLFCVPLLQSATGILRLSHALNGVSWFLSSLFCIYVVSPFFLIFFGKINKFKSVITTLALNILTLIVVRSVFYEIQDRSFFDDLVYGSPYCRFLYVSIGMLLAKVVVLLKANIAFEKQRGSYLELLALFFVIGAFVSKIFAWPFDGVFLQYAGILISVITILIFSFESGFVSDFLQWGWLKVLGKMSMFLFLIHYPIQRYFILFFRFAGLHQSFKLYVCSISITLILSFAISYILLERNKNGMQ